MNEQEPFPGPPLDHLAPWRPPASDGRPTAAAKPQERPLLSPTRPRHGGSILMAAMIGLANALGFDPAPEQTEIMQPADKDKGSDLDLRFGDLPPLN